MIYINKVYVLYYIFTYPHTYIYIYIYIYITRFFVALFAKTIIHYLLMHFSLNWKSNVASFSRVSLLAMNKYNLKT